jgi:hypothetical protein
MYHCVDLEVISFSFFFFHAGDYSILHILGKHSATELQRQPRANINSDFSINLCFKFGLII